MNSSIDEMVAELASRDYRTRIEKETLSTGEEVFVAYHPDLPGCMAQGKSLTEALKSLDEARMDYIRSLVQDGVTVPMPAQSVTYSSSSASMVSRGGTVVIAWESEGYEVPAEESDDSDGELVFEGAMKS